MKPINLKIKGLNSFIDEQEIDFAKLTDKGLFGIFGPTGSGKSTILDGITLALYGNVARKSSNYINTNCEKLNVEFEFQISGVTHKKYRIDREFKRNKDTGNPNSGKCKIVDITEEKNQVLADKVGSVNEKVVEILGLNLDDFTRTVVLPQGKFSDFLKLEGKDRREMLERLFNLQKYGEELSKKLGANINKEKSNHNILIGQLSAYENISEELFKSKSQEITLLNENLKKLQEDFNKIEIEYKEKEELWKLQNELDAYRIREKELREQEEEINLEIEKIRLGEAGIRIVPYINAYENTIKKLDQYNIQIQSIKKTLLEINNKKEQTEIIWNDAKYNKETKLPELTLKEQKVKDAIEEEKIVLGIQKKIQILENNIEEEIKRYEKIKNILKESKEKKMIVNENIKNFEETYEKLKIDEILKEKINQGILQEEKYNNIKSNLNKYEENKITLEKENVETTKVGKALAIEIGKKDKVLEEKNKDLDELIKNCPGDQKQLLSFQETLVKKNEQWKKYNILSKEIKEAKEDINNLNKNIVNEKAELLKLNNLLEMEKNNLKEITKNNLAAKIREQLKDGEVCPVCGSTDHIKENIEFIEIINTENLENEIKAKENLIKSINQEIIIKETKVSNLNEKISENEKEIKEFGNDFKENSLKELEENFERLKEAIDIYTKTKDKLEKDISELKIEINTENGNINELRAVIRTNNRQLKEIEAGISKNSKELKAIINIIDEIKKETKVEDFKKKSVEIIQAERKRDTLSKQIKENRKNLEELIKTIDELISEENLINEELAKSKADLNSYYQNKEEKINSIKNKIGQEKNLQELLENVQNTIEKIKENFNKAEFNKTEVEKLYNANNEQLISVLSNNEELLKRKESDKEKLDSSISKEGFININQVKENLIEEDKLKKYKDNVEKYKDNLSKINGTIENLLNKINSRELTKEEWAEIISLKNELEINLKKINEDKIKLESEIKNIEIKLKELKSLLEEKKKIEHKLALLGDLDKLFKGKKFVEFVAANQLKYISIEASKRLQEITHENYGLEVDENGKFLIRDYKNGGAERDASTLSGGETFLVSLSLALALSTQIQLKGTAPLELFFLDEGFGTLDEDLLEIVMNSLEKIHNDKLKVGIISHVETIKNRIPVKLIVTPSRSGMGGSKVKIERS